MVDIGDFLVLAEQFRINGLSVGCGEAEVKQHRSPSWLVEDSDTVRSEADGGDRRPLGVVSATAENSKGVEFKELTFG